MTSPHREETPLRGRIPDPLDASFTDADRALDDRLGSALSGASTPTGLVGRIHEVTMADLPGPRVLHLVGRDPSSTRVAPAWRRLALAAGIGIAAITGAWRLLDHAATSPEIPMRVVVNDTDGAPAGRAGSLLGREAESMLLDDLGNGHDMAWLADARDATLGDLTDDLVMLVAELEWVTGLER